MSTEKDFLAAIKADSDDRAKRLIYADWLEEHGDQRAELIRIEEEMRSIAIYGDKYWKLKPRRNELRKAAKKSWRQSMKYGTDYEPVFREIPDGWKERWRLIREFAERWFGVPMGDVGGQREEISKIERKEQLSLPPSL